jgi:hypothetical protein
LPGSSSREGGFEEFPEFRDNRCSSLASRPASVSLTSINSEICTACALICTAWRRTTTINSSRDSSSGSGIGRSNRTPADHPVTDTPIVPTSHYQRG